MRRWQAKRYIIYICDNHISVLKFLRILKKTFIFFFAEFMLLLYFCKFDLFVMSNISLIVPQLLPCPNGFF